MIKNKKAIAPIVIFLVVIGASLAGLFFLSTTASIGATSGIISGLKSIPIWLWYVLIGILILWLLRK